MSCKCARDWVKTLIILLCLPVAHSFSQEMTKIQRAEVLNMLQQISPDIQKHYYDAKLHGVDWKAAIDKANQEIEAAKSEPQAVSAIAGALVSLNDSHTFFLPPPYAAHFGYGWQGEMVGDHCLVLRVRPGSDAEKKGLKPGDEVMAINGFAPVRDDFWKMQYVFKLLRPQPGFVMDVRDPDGQQRHLEVQTKIVPQQQVVNLTGSEGEANVWDLVRQEETEDYLGRAQFESIGDVGILKLPSFDFDITDVDKMMGHARKEKALVIDMRGNPGGYEKTLQYLIGATFDKEVKIGDRVGRSDHKPIVAKPHGNPYSGKLVVLVDSRSASAAELYARVVQLEKRGAVVGDRSAGAVMEAKRYSYTYGADTVVQFGASITDADIVMTDGKSLEHTGVTPDDVMLPTAADLAAGRDPVLSHAVETLGGKLTPEAAGRLFPYEWPKI